MCLLYPAAREREGGHVEGEGRSRGAEEGRWQGTPERGAAGALSLELKKRANEQMPAYLALASFFENRE